MGEINTLCTLNDVYELALICQYTIFEAVLIYIYIYIYIYISKSSFSHGENFVK